MLQVLDVTEKKSLFAFQNRLKPWVRQEVEQKGVQKLSEAMTVAKSMVKLGLGKDKLRFSKPEKMSVCEKDHKEDVVDGNGNGDNGGNGKPRVGKKKPKRKMDKLKCFLCDGPHILKKCLKKFALSKKEKSVGKALLWKCSKKSVIEGDDGADKEPKKLGSSKGKVEAKRAKMSKKK
ncbi:hypothetical protein Gohar_011381 [Gossypium harknessii]|uniref:Uncharacterized protein n=1 Tax=Gossypium harknessii TaxID=34285 RepID=A0A7J9GTU7_9ROSI|nr:hypothetical protein [Gossypium harknessii]